MSFVILVSVPNSFEFPGAPEFDSLLGNVRLELRIPVYSDSSCTNFVWLDIDSVLM